MLTFSLLASADWSRDAITGGIALGAVASLIAALYFAEGSTDAQAADDANHQDTDE